jgi:branched-chain amino acid aminotransferase
VRGAITLNWPYIRMSEPIAYLNGQLIPASKAVVSVTDVGFMMGVTVAEQLRTFNGKLFRLDEHLDRLDRSLAIVGVDSKHSREKLVETATHVAATNKKLLAPDDDLVLVIFVTPGDASTSPTVCMHTRPVPFAQWADKYQTGESLCTTAIVQVSPRSWPTEIKCRSRMHYYLADRYAAIKIPGSRALMHDEHGFVTEATTANVLIYRQSEGLLTPPQGKVLPGISLSVLRQLAAEVQIPFTEQDLEPSDIAAADEVLLCSTSPCILPVTRFNGAAVGSGQPGPIFAKILGAWSNLVGVEIAEQARRFKSRS